MREELKLLGNFFITSNKITNQTIYEIKEIDARELIVPERLDLMAKWIYIDSYINNRDLEYAKEVYEKHLQAFSLNSFCEPGNENKKSLKDYINVFNKLIDDIKKCGVDSNISLIPVGKDNVILDGAHRVSCAAYFNQKVKIVYFPHLSVNFNYEYFRNRKLSEEIISHLIMKYCEIKNNNVYFGCLWPISNKKDCLNKARTVLKDNSRVIFDSRVNLNKNGMRNFMLQIYGNQDWVGTIHNHFSGLNGKVNECYRPNNSIKIVIFEKESLDDVLKLKDDIGNIFNIGKHSIHISDNVDESRLMCQLLLNENSLHHLNHGYPDKNINIFQNCRDYYKSNKSSMEIYNAFVALAIYGLQEFQCDDVENNISNVVSTNPRKYFIFMNQKFVSLSEMEKIDDDIKISKAVKELLKKEKVLTDQRRKMLYLKTQMQWYRENGILKLKQIVAKFLSLFGIYQLINKLRGR